MDALYIVNSKNCDILIAKEFHGNENNLKLSIFLMEMNTLTKNEKSPYLMIKDSVFIFLKYGNILYLTISSEDSMITFYLTCLQNIHKILIQAFENNLDADSIRDNFVEITLMIDQYLLNGVPVISDTNVLSTLVNPYKLKDKITEKFIGKAKEYETKTILNYLNETQVTFDNYKYYNENIKSNYEVLFHFVDYLDLTCDKYFNQINKQMSSEIEVFSQIPYNIDLNLLLNLPFNVLDLSVDDGVSTKRSDIMKKKNLDCTIKHGTYKLIEFIPNITTKLNLPFKISINTNWTNNNMTINIQIELESIRETFFNLEDVEIQILFPEGFHNSNLSVNLGDFEFSGSKTEQVYSKWTLNKLEKNQNAILKGSISGGNSNAGSSSCVFLLSCKIDKFSISGGSVTKGTITKNPKNVDISKKSRNFTYIKNLEIIF